MQLKPRFNKHTAGFFIFIVLCCLLILSVGSSLLSPPEEGQSLEVLALNPETLPVFRMQAQLSYEPTEVNTWISTFSDTKATSSIESSTLTGNSLSDSPLNLVIALDDTSLDLAVLSKDLEQLTQYFPAISLSLIPSQTMTDTTYLSQCEQLAEWLKQKEFSSILLIIYPVSTDKLSLYDQDFITHIGTVLHSQTDLNVFDQIYNAFSKKKTLVVRDAIRSFYLDDSSQAAREITATYYLLAVNYPDVETIFSPIIKPAFNHNDDYILSQSDADFALFNAIYGRLVYKPWITTSNKEVSSTSPYVPLTDYSQLTGETEIILAPNTLCLTTLETLPNNESAVYFKWNNQVLTLNMSYPYSITLDTTTQPNGISRLSVIVQDTHLNDSESYSIDLIISNPTESERAPRANNWMDSVTKGTLASKTSSKNAYIPILMYHTIEDEVSPENQNSHVETANFDAQMNALITNGYTPINFYDLKSYLDGQAPLPEHPILITMDDGYLNNYTNAYPIYQKYNIQATLFVSPYYMKEENTDRHFGWNAAKEMEDSGLIDIQSHGYDHTPLPYLSTKDIKYHVSLAVGTIEKYLGPRDVAVVAYPQFRHNRRTVSTLSSLGIDFQMINLARKGTVLTPPTLKRINVPNTMPPEDLITTLDKLTS